VELKKEDSDSSLCDYGRNVRVNRPWNFEVDVAAMCGYQLHLFRPAGDADYCRQVQTMR
jgi:hypothetical protein